MCDIVPLLLIGCLWNTGSFRQGCGPGLCRPGCPAMWDGCGQRGCGQQCCGQGSCFGQPCGCYYRPHRDGWCGC
jgi:hypothetical protein